MDKRRFRKKMLADLVLAPWTIVPAVLGVAALVVSGGRPLSSLGLFGVVSLLTGLGSLVARWSNGRDKVEARAWKRLQDEEWKRREHELDRLDRRLRRDGDPRTEASLRELRVIYENFRRDPSWSRRLQASAVVELEDKVEQLFHGCLDSLTRAQELWESAARMRTEEHKRSLLERRAELVEEVGQSVQQLARSVDGVVALALEDGGESDQLARIRRELDESLEVARRVEERVSALDLDTQRQRS